MKEDFLFILFYYFLFYFIFYFIFYYVYIFYFIFYPHQRTFPHCCNILVYRATLQPTEPHQPGPSFIISSKQKVSWYYTESEAVATTVRGMFPESHSEFRPDNLFDGVRGQKLDLAEDRIKIMKGSWGFHIGVGWFVLLFWFFQVLHCKLFIENKINRICSGECPGEDRHERHRWAWQRECRLWSLISTLTIYLT